LTVMLAKFIAQIDLVLNSKQWTCLNKACYLVTRLVQLLYAVFVMRMEFHQTRNQITWCFVQSRLLFWINKIDLHDENLASITIKYDFSAPCALDCTLAFVFTLQRSTKQPKKPDTLCFLSISKGKASFRSAITVKCLVRVLSALYLLHGHSFIV